VAPRAIPSCATRELLVSRRFPALLLALPVATTACISLQVGGKSAAKADASFAPLPPRWARVEATATTSTWRAPDGAVMGLTSACDGQADTAFGQLVDTIVASVPQRETVAPTTPLDATPLPSRIAHVRGRGDAPVEMVAIVMKSPACVYDVTLTGRELTAADVDEAKAAARAVRVEPSGA
jgi:hypothetical protein